MSLTPAKKRLGPITAARWLAAQPARAHRGRDPDTAARWLAAAGFILVPGAIILRTGSTIGDLRLSLILLGFGALAGWLAPSPERNTAYRCMAGALAASSWLVILGQFWRVTDYPLSLTWSEGNHLWDASLFLTPDRYTLATPILIPNYATPGLYILRGLPLLIPNITLLWVVHVLKERRKHSVGKPAVDLARPAVWFCAGQALF